MNRRTSVKSRFGWLAEFSPKRLVPWVRNHALVARSSWKRLLEEPLQTALTVGVIAIALALSTLLFQLAAMGGSALGQMNNTSDINLYFELGTEVRSIEAFEDMWRGDPRVQATQVITPEQGLAEFESFSGLGSILSSFDENPLPAVVRITPADRLAGRAAELRLLVQALQASEFVETAVLDFAWLDRLNAVVEFVDRLSIAVGLLLALGILLILGNTIRLTIENRRNEIVVIKLVGGTDRFVQRPLLYAGFWYGLLGGAVAVVLVAIVGALLSYPLQQILLSYQSSVQTLPGVSFPVFINLLVLGASLGCSGAWLSVLQHLRNIEPT